MSIATLISKYDQGNSNALKLVALCIKAVTGVFGASMILNHERPYITLIILCAGVLANEILNFIATGAKSRKIKLIALCVKAVTGILGASMILTEQRPYLTLLILSIGAIANEVLNFISTEEQIPFPEDTNNPKPPSL